jgi:hypothetical protein
MKKERERALARPNPSNLQTVVKTIPEEGEKINLNKAVATRGSKGAAADGDHRATTF